VVQEGEAWLAQIVRHVTSKKTTISKQRGGFATEQQAIAWGETALLEFSQTQSSSNQRHGVRRKKNDQIKRQRSTRRSDKTAAQKEAKAALKASLDAGPEGSSLEGTDSPGSGT